MTSATTETAAWPSASKRSWCAAAARSCRISPMASSWDWPLTQLPTKSLPPGYAGRPRVFSSGSGVPSTRYAGASRSRCCGTRGGGLRDGGVQQRMGLAYSGGQAGVRLVRSQTYRAQRERGSETGRSPDQASAIVVVGVSPIGVNPLLHVNCAVPWVFARIVWPALTVSVSDDMAARRRAGACGGHVAAAVSAPRQGEQSRCVPSDGRALSLEPRATTAARCHELRPPGSPPLGGRRG